MEPFFIQAVIYLGAAILVVPLAKRLGLGSVLGYLIAGILIGPFVLGWIGGNGEDIMQFAEMGVVMMLFLIGLDIEPRMLWRMRRSILGLGGLQVAVTAIVTGFFAHQFFGLTVNQSIALGLIFAMSSTAIVLQTMAENNWIQTSAGQNAFSVLLFQDIAVIFILAIMPLLGPGNPVQDSGPESAFLSHFPQWIRTLMVIGAVGIIVVGGRYLSRPLFRMVASTNMRELFAATGLLLVFGITVLMVLVGLSPALGAFLGGVVLANSEYKPQLEGDIEPFKGLLLGLFFIAVGASIDFHLIAQQPLLILVIVLGVMIAKLIILLVLGKLFHLSRQQYLLFGFALAQVGEFAFVLLNFSVQQHIFSKDLSSLLMVVVAASMALTPIFLLFLDRVWMAHVYNRFGAKKEEEVVIPEIQEQNNVIIAGYGRFGSIIGRLLKVNGIESTVLESDSDRVETLRKLGVKVYYGDALRIDLLKNAGADKAKLIVVALDENAQKGALVKIIKERFPQAQIIVRARGQKEAYELMDAGILHIYRETFDTSLRAGHDALTLLGINEKAAKHATELFFEHDQKALKALAAARFDEEEYYSIIRSGVDDLQARIQKDMEEQEKLKSVNKSNTSSIN